MENNQSDYSQLSLFDATESNKKNIEEKYVSFPNLDIVVYRNFFSENTSNKYFIQLQQEILWTQEKTWIYGKKVNLPRLTSWYGDESSIYTYSRIKMEPHPWTQLLKHIKIQVENELNSTFNSVLLNLYRHGLDSISWHSDDEIELGRNPVIASLSLGGKRKFMLRHKVHKNIKLNIELTNGSLLLMKNETQTFWQHQIPKTQSFCPPRINLTFRKILR